MVPWDGTRPGRSLELTFRACHQLRSDQLTIYFGWKKTNSLLCVINKFLNLRGFYVEWELWKVNENFCIWLDHFQSINSKFISLWRSNRFWISSGENGRKKMCLEKILDLSRSDYNDPLKTITVSAILRLSLFRSY